MRFSRSDKIVATAFAIIFVVLAAKSFLERNTPSPRKAYAITQEFVKDRIQTPASAEFPAFNQVSVVEMPDNRFETTGFFDAQNLFSAKLRTYYVCVVKFNPENKDRQWSLERIVFDR